MTALSTNANHSGPRSYRGLVGGTVQAEGTSGKDAAPLEPRCDLRNHSPTGFAWGYSGSGPSQLALALLADALGDDDLARHFYQLSRIASSRAHRAARSEGRSWWKRSAWTSPK